ncbi:MAG: hypothetical protein OXM02_00140, partial [Bacteroidota bacterium]|nr:hypothetical protein [Bacteroidota bacterium]MDE2832913.1 hypothetical protein [Bacteroidota bacterium]
ICELQCGKLSSTRHIDLQLIVKDSIYCAYFGNATLEDGRVIDVYDAPTGDYLYSFYLPENRDSYVMNDRLYQLDRNGGGVHVYEIGSPDTAGL